MSIRSKLGLETYAPKDPEPVVPEGPVEFDSPSGVVEQTNDLVEDLTDLSGSVRTLESIAQAIESAEDADFSASTAQIIAAAIDTVAGPAKTIAAEKFQQAGMTKPAALRKAAQEALADKFTAIKASISKLIQKIIEKLEAFWRWLTMNHKRVLKRLNAAKNQLTDAPAKADLKFQKNWINLMHTNVFEPQKVGQLGGYLAELCISAGTFIESGFQEVSKIAADPRLNIDYSNKSMRIRVGAAFKHFKVHDDGEIELYNGIAGRYLYLTVSNRDTDFNKDFSPTFRVHLRSMRENSQLPHETTVYKEDMRKILTGAVEAVDASEKHFEKVNRIRNKLRAMTAIGGTGLAVITVAAGPQPALMALTAMLGSYSSAISAFIDGVFLQSVRFGSAAADLADAYMKQDPKTSHTEDEPAPADALRLTAR